MSGSDCRCRWRSSPRRTNESSADQLCAHVHPVIAHIDIPHSLMCERGVGLWPSLWRGDNETERVTATGCGWLDPPTRRTSWCSWRRQHGESAIGVARPLAVRRPLQSSLRRPSSSSSTSWSLICAGLDIDGEQSWSMAGRPRACARSLPMCSVGAGGSAVAIAAVHGQRRCMECHAHRVVLSAHVTLLLGA